jgi:hypothetical protein
MHAPPGLEVRDDAFDHVPHLVDRGVEFFLPVKQFTSGRFAEWGGGSGANEAFVTNEVFSAGVAVGSRRSADKMGRVDDRPKRAWSPR